MLLVAIAELKTRWWSSVWITFVFCLGFFLKNIAFFIIVTQMHNCSSLRLCWQKLWACELWGVMSVGACWDISPEFWGLSSSGSQLSTDPPNSDINHKQTLEVKQNAFTDYKRLVCRLKAETWGHKHFLGTICNVDASAIFSLGVLGETDEQSSQRRLVLHRAWWDFVCFGRSKMKCFLCFFKHVREILVFMLKEEKKAAVLFSPHW